MYAEFYKNILYPLYEGRLRGRSTIRYIRRMNETQWLSPDEIARFQWNELKRLLDHAGGHCPYYRDAFQKAGLNPEDIRSLEDFRRLSVISKEDIRKNKDAMAAENYLSSNIPKSTGGSTGEPLRFFHDRNSYEWRIAAAFRGYSWAGCEDGQKVFYIWGADIGEPVFLKQFKQNIHNTLRRRKTFNSFRFTEENMKMCLDAINRFKPAGIVGYTTPLYNFARYIRDTGARCAPVRSVISASEKLFDYQRDLFRDVFKADVFNTYGCREFMLIACECEHHNGLHLTADNLLVEVLKDGRPAGPGETGEIVVTDLHNYGMPFIRYRNGDLAVASDDRRCACGRGLPLINDVEGRVLDSIQTTDGRIIPGVYFPHLMKEFDEIRKFQIIQKSKDRILVKAVREKELSAQRKEFLDKELRRIIGHDIIVDMRYVEDIPLTDSGKYRVTISEVPVDFGNEQNKADA